MATSHRKTEIKNYIQEHGETKTADLVEAFGLRAGYIRTLLREMVAEGTIEKVGNNRYSRYRLRETV